MNKNKALKTNVKNLFIDNTCKAYLKIKKCTYVTALSLTLMVGVISPAVANASTANGSTTNAQTVAKASTVANTTASIATLPKADLEDGIYTVDVTTSSSMFKIYEADKNTCKLIVVDGEMYAKFNLNGTSYKYLYMGNKEEAANAEASDYIKYKVKTFDDPDIESFEVYNYTIPVSALDKEIVMAAYSTRSGNWFDRTMTFSNPVNSAMEISKIEKSEVSGIKATSKKGKITVSWKRSNVYDGYQIYSSTKPFDGFKKIKTIKTNKLTISGKKAGKTYYYKVRGTRSIAGKTVYSQFSKTVVIKVK